MMEILRLWAQAAVALLYTRYTVYIYFSLYSKYSRTLEVFFFRSTTARSDLITKFGSKVADLL